MLENQVDDKVKRIEAIERAMIGPGGAPKINIIGPGGDNVAQQL